MAKGILPSSGWLSSSKGSDTPAQKSGGFLDGILGIGGSKHDVPAQKSGGSDVPPGRAHGAARGVRQGTKPNNDARGKKDKGTGGKRGDKGQWKATQVPYGYNTTSKRDPTLLDPKEGMFRGDDYITRDARNEYHIRHSDGTVEHRHANWDGGH